MIILFMARNHRQYPTFEMESLKDFLSKDNSRKILILRGCLWFYETQKATIGDMRKHFTEDAIAQLLDYGYFEFIEEKKESTLSTEEITDIEYLQTNLLKALALPNMENHEENLHKALGVPKEYLGRKEDEK